MAAQTRVIDVDHWLGDIVFLRPSRERRPGIVTGVQLMASGDPPGTIYRVTWDGGTEGWHYGCELTDKFQDWGQGGEEP